MGARYVASVLTVVSFIQTTTLEARPSSRPNIIVILVDDLGSADVGFRGCKDIPTPHIDQLAASGVECTQGYVSFPVCSPTRAGLLTGRYQQRFGHENNPHYDPDDTVSGLPTSQRTMADLLRGAGYATGAIGKWHLGAAECFRPNRRGFDEFFGFLGGGHVYFSGLKASDEYQAPILRNEQPVDEKEYLTEAFTREALGFVQRHRDGPFFLYLAYNAVHAPLQVPKERLAEFASLSDPRRRSYAAMLAVLDDGIGRLTATLREDGRLDDTLIFFLSDNGGPSGVEGGRGNNGSDNRPLRGQKGQLYEGGIRTPFIVSWPARIKAGTKFDSPVISLDILPTALAAAGTPPPPEPPLDGVNLLPALTGQSTAAPHEELHWRTGGGTSWAIRRGNLKLLHLAKRDLLFDLAADPFEQHDCSAERADTVNELLRVHEAWNVQLIPPLFKGSAEVERAKISSAQPVDRPNILWIVAEDLGPDLACYGRTDVSTPNLDRLAAEGRRYLRAYSTAPICSPARTALMTGAYPTSFAANNHRSNRQPGALGMPPGVELLSDRFRRVGYFTANVTDFPTSAGLRGTGKTDFNFAYGGAKFDSSRWSDLKSHQPFFAQVNLHEAHRIYHANPKRPVDPATVTLPPYLADHPLVRKDWAAYLGAIQTVDTAVGEVLKLLASAGLAENTIVMFMGDNGREDFRGKYHMFEQGCSVPLLVRAPGFVSPGSVSDELVSGVDIAATSLSLARIDVAKPIHGRPFLGPQSQKRKYLFTAMGRIDDNPDQVRVVRDARWKYVRNFQPGLPYLQENGYRATTNPTYSMMRILHAAHKLDSNQQKFMASTRPAEELYDLQVDPYEFNNLAGDSTRVNELSRLRGVLDVWMRENGDQPGTSESQASVDFSLEQYEASRPRTLSRNRKELLEAYHDLFEVEAVLMRTALP